MPKQGEWAVGQWVIYRKPKYSSAPGPRAKAVAPAAHGDLYSYYVEKFWVITEILPDGWLVLRTRRGKENRVRPDDRNLCPAHWWEKLIYRRRFRAAERPAPADDKPDSPEENSHPAAASPR